MPPARRIEFSERGGNEGRAASGVQKNPEADATEPKREKYYHGYKAFHSDFGTLGFAVGGDLADAILLLGRIYNPVVVGVRHAVPIDPRLGA